MISPVTIAIIGVFGIVFTLVIVAFIILMRRQAGEPRRRYKVRREGNPTNRDYQSSGYIPYKDTPELSSRRRESIVIIGVIVLFIVLSVLASFVF